MGKGLRNFGATGKMLRIVAAISIGLTALGVAGAAGARTGAGSYPAMAPVEQYLMPDRAQEIAQAREAAPPPISDDAEILVLERDGYATAVKGKNGFVCLVQRAWFSGLNDDGFWNPHLRAPICFNPQGARSVLPAFLERTRWAMAGLSKAEMIDRTQIEIAAHTFPVPEAGTLTFMMARDAYLNDQVKGPWHPHLMFFVPRLNAADWGSNLPGSPVMGGDDGIEPWTLFFVPVADWSDGTPDANPPMAHSM